MVSVMMSSLCESSAVSTKTNAKIIADMRAICSPVPKENEKSVPSEIRPIPATHIQAAMILEMWGFFFAMSQLTNGIIAQ